LNVEEDLATMRRLFEQLKRRNVLRAATGYAVIAWLIIQVVDTVFPILGVPAWVTTMVVVLAIIGFPVTVIVSWIYQWTPAGIMTDKEAGAAGYAGAIGVGRQIDFVIIVLLIIAVGWLVYDKTVEPTLDNSIAVLPFVNMTADPENEYFADGMSEEILNLLVQIPDLRVIGRTSSFSFKGKDVDLRTIGRTLGAATLLEGSVRRSGNRIRITAQLINAGNGSPLWSETYDRELSDIFQIQEDVAAAMIGALQIHIGTLPARGRPTESTEAYALFLKARTMVNRLELRQAKDLILKAIELDPNFAEAYELLASVYWIMPEGTTVLESQRLLRATAGKAIKLDPDLALARLYYSVSMPGPDLRLRTIEAYERAARERPSDPFILEGFIFVLTEFGYLQEALASAERFIELDPLSELVNIHLPLTLYSAGRTEEAVGALEFANQSDWRPHLYRWTTLGMNLLESPETAIAHVETYLQRKDYPDPNWFEELVTSGRDPATGKAYLDRRIPEIVAAMAEVDKFEWQNGLISLYLYFGYLDRYYELVLATDPVDTTWHDAGGHLWRAAIFKRLGSTANAKYVELARLMGVFDVWEQRGPPDFCDKIGGYWICQ
jgi:serine/threonine-protein kinase